MGMQERIAGFPFPARIALAAFCAFLADGCLYTTHHYNSGKLLEPGRTSITAGYGNQPYRTPHCPDNSDLQPSGNETLCVQAGSGETVAPVYTPGNTPTFSFGYRLGVREKWGPFTGAELGWQIEAPTNPGSVEFDFKLGLPVPAGLPMAHSASAGWIIGMWADNSFFFEWAGSHAFGSHYLFGNTRVTWLATQPDAVFEDAGKFRFHQDKRWVWQGSLGFRWRWADIPVLPDCLIPLVTASYPGVPSLGNSVAPPADGVQWNYSLGFGWEFK
jgi:hypothetical protein